MTKLVDNVIKVAKTQIGVHEGRSNGHWNNDQKYSNEVPGLAWSDFQPWCCTFVSWVAFKSGAGDLYPRTASCDVAGAWFKAKGRWSEYPAVGAQVFYGVPRDLNHTGIVIAFDADSITTVEGNTNLSGSREGDGVYLRKRLRRTANVSATATRSSPAASSPPTRPTPPGSRSPWSRRSCRRRSRSRSAASTASTCPTTTPGSPCPG
jgi:hypothetical protein